MSQPCVIDTCKRTSRALCHCCQQNVCIPHLNEHNDLLNSKLYPLADEINALSERLKTSSVENLVGDCRQKLAQWREECHQKIEQYFEQKCHELDRFAVENLEELRKNITDIQTKVADLIRDQEATRSNVDTLTTTIGDLEKEISKTERIHLCIDLPPLMLNDTMVKFQRIYEQELDPSIFLSTHKTIVRPKGSSNAVAANGRSLLIHQIPKLCLLNAELTVIDEVLWPYGRIHDICWSTILTQFIVIEENAVFLVDETTMSIETIQAINKQSWLSGTCFDKQLFLLTKRRGSSILKIILSPSIEVITEWKSPKTCTTDEVITGIVYNNGTLALVIGNKVDISIRIELRSCSTLDRLWSLPLDVAYDRYKRSHWCSLKNNEWLGTDRTDGRLLHVTADGKMKQTITYKAIPLRILPFGPNTYVVVTNRRINLHKI